MTNLELWNTVAIATTSLLATFLVYAWTSLALALVFRKSGESGWKAWVPVLNIVVLLRLGGLSGWLVLLFIIPIAGWVALLIAVHRINVSFGYGGGMMNSSTSQPDSPPRRRSTTMLRTGTQAFHAGSPLLRKTRASARAVQA